MGFYERFIGVFFAGSAVLKLGCFSNALCVIAIYVIKYDINFRE